MAKSIDFLNNITLVLPTSKFSDEAKATGLKTATENLCKALSFVLDAAKRLNDYERQDAVCSTYDGLYGADELCLNLPEATRRHASKTSTYNSYSSSGGFYLTARQIATKMWGLATDDLPTTTAGNYPRDYFGGYLRYYNGCLDELEADGVPVADYWKIAPHIPDDVATGDRITVTDANSYFYNRYIRYSTSSITALTTPHAFFGAVANIRGHLRLLKIMMDKTPSGKRGGKTFPASYSLRDCLYSFPQFQPHDLVRIRQALTEVRAGYTYYDNYSPGTATNSVTSGRIGNRIKKALLNRGITFASAEIDDTTLDISDYYARAAKISDPLIIAAAGFAGVESAETYGTKTTWAQLVPAVHLCRKYLMRCYAVAYDYKEADNPNAFEQANGKLDYSLSNSRVFTNSRCSSASAWKVKAHDYDAYYTTSQYTYLQSISDILRANIAKTWMSFNFSQTATEVKDPDGRGWRGMMIWAFLPTLTMFGVQNKLSARKWSNNAAQIAVDYANYLDADGEEWIGSFNSEAGVGVDDSIVYDDEVSQAKDLLENAWELGNRRYQFQVNPECSDASTARTYLYIPTSTPCVCNTDTLDATIANRVACFYLPKADGTATTNQLGYTNPYNYQPATYAFTLVPFHTTETDGTAPACVSEPVMSYSATEFADL